MTSTIKLEIANAGLDCNLANGADITRLVLGGKEVIKPTGADEAENPWLFPFPNRLREGKYAFEGKQYQFPLNDFGRPNALHGYVRERAFKLEGEGKNDYSAWVELSYSDDGALVSYPFPFRLSLRYELAKDRLDLTVSIENQGDTNMPAGLGWHPYFYLPDGLDKASLSLPRGQEILVDENLVPTGKKRPSTCFDGYTSLNDVELDTCFEPVKENETKILLKSPAYELLLWQDKHFGYLQAYTPDDRKSIALEPMTCSIDAFNTGEGLKFLASGEIWTVKCGVRIT